MTIDATNPTSLYQNVSTTGKLSTDSATALDSLTKDYTTFITMLTTQLKNQDPLSPMDSAQFTQQLVAFAGVEQQIKGNNKLDSLISLQSSNSTSSYLGYLGKEVEAKGEQLSLTSDSYGKFSYTLPNVASTAKVTITNSAGEVVRTQNVSGSIGKHVVQWDGKNDAGTSMPNGTYTIKVAATGADGTAMKPTITTFGIVQGMASNTSGSIDLMIGGKTLDIGDVLSVNYVTPASSTSSGSSS